MSSYCKAVDKYINEQEQYSVVLNQEIKVIELFAGVGGFRIGLERASDQFKTVWSSQWEPATKKQDASEIYVKRFGSDGHSNENVCTVGVDQIPEADMVVGGFPCLTGDTLITTSRGLVRIDAIKPGDVVMTHKGRFRKVLRTFDQGEKETYKITTMSAKTNKGTFSHTIYATGNHKFLVYKNYELMPCWMTVDEIRATECPINFCCHVPELGNYTPPVQNIVSSGIQHVYDIEVAEDHSFMANGIYTHNCQDYSVASTLNRSGGIEGKKGVLWWEIYRILKDSEHKPSYCIFENVDRLLKSPAKQRGRDFAIILASLANLGYDVEWRVINAADYGMPQRRRRTYMVAYRNDEELSTKIRSQSPETVIYAGVIGAAFKAVQSPKGKLNTFTLDEDLVKVSDEFNKGKKTSPFFTAGVLRGREVTTVDVEPQYDGYRITLGDVLVDEKDVPEEFFISEKDLPRWEYLKGGKSEKRVTSEGFEYNYTEGPMAFPDSPEKPSRTIITGEGGTAPSRFKHVVKTPSGRYRRLMPVELERLNMFPDNHTEGVTNTKRAFLMGNALVTGIVSQIGRSLARFIA